MIIPNIWKNKKMFQTTNQYIYIYVYYVAQASNPPPTPDLMVMVLYVRCM